MAKPPEHQTPRAKDAPLVSVVTPVFNGGQYLVECIESVIGQSYQNWEYLLVDNASNDLTPEIISRFASKDSRIKHLRFEDHVGAIDNHNRALRSIDPSSEFCKILQADDWLYPECLTKMVAAGLASESIGLVGAYFLWDTEVHLTGLPYSTVYAEGKDILRQCLLGRFDVTGSPTSGLLRSEVVRSRDPFYDPALWHTDREAGYWVLNNHDLGFVHQVLTFVRRQAGTRAQFSRNANSSEPEMILLLLRYGPAVLSAQEYRRVLRHHLRAYVWWHVRQLPRPSRLRQAEFFGLHRARVARILDEAGGDPEVRVAMRIIETMLRRRPLAVPEGAGLPH
jgi:glycosyltransferase involved in cell wall biosynthesis